MTRNSPLWWIGIIGSILALCSTQFGLLHLDPIWKDRIEFIAGVVGIISAFLRMSPLALSSDSTLAGTSNPDKTLFDMNKK